MKSQNNLILSADRSAWSALAHHGTEWDQSSKMSKVRNQILKRDDNTCQGCGWRSERWQEIHHRNGDHSDYNLDNLETLCPLCHQVFHLPTAAATSGGSIIWLPEMTQAQLNLICIAIFVAIRDNRSRWKHPAQALFQQFEARKAIMEEQMGSCDPGALAQVLIKLSPEQYQERQKIISPLRLLPYHTRFQTAIEHWATVDFKRRPPEMWEDVLPSHFNLAEIIQSSEEE